MPKYHKCFYGQILNLVYTSEVPANQHQPASKYAVFLEYENPRKGKAVNFITNWQFGSLAGISYLVSQLDIGLGFHH